MAAEDGLKAQKLLAQGIALGNVCKKQSRPERAKALKLKAFALSGRQVYIHKSPGRCPGLGVSALSGRMGQYRAYGAKLAKVLFIVHYKLDIINYTL